MKKAKFEVESKITAKSEGLTKGKTYTVYSVKLNAQKRPLFLVYNDNGEWDYVGSWYTKPIEE